MTGPRRRPGASRIRATTVASALVAALAVLPGGAGAQLDDGTDRIEAMPDAPRTFRVGPAVSAFLWPDAEGTRNGVEDLIAGGAELEATVSRWLGFRLGVGVGATTIASSSDQEADARQFLVEFLAAGRLPVGRLAELGVTPWAEVGVGTLVHHPTDTLRTRNQNALVVGLGADVEISGRIGVRGGWRTLDVEQSDVFDPDDRGSTGVRVHRIVAVLYWRF